MGRLQAAIAFGCALAMTSGALSARGQTSYTLPEIRLAVAPRAIAPTPPSWATTLDPPQANDDVLAFGKESVVFASDGRICSHAEATGRTNWCASPGSQPIAVATEFVYVVSSAEIEAVSQAGVTKWRYRFGAGRSSTPGTSIYATLRIWPTGGDIAFARSSGDGYVEYGELRASGILLWSTRLLGIGDAPLVRFPYGIWAVHQSGGMPLTTLQHIVRFGAAGGLGDVISTYDRAVDFTKRQALFAGDPSAEEEERSLSFQVQVLDVLTGRSSYYDLQPDYATNAAAYRNGTLGAGGEISQSIRFDAGWLYGAVGDKIYRYRLTHAPQRPLLVSREATFLGGPILGVLYASRPGGVWSLRPRERDVEARLIAPSSSPVTAFALDATTAYLGFADGHVRAVRSVDGQPTMDTYTCPATRISWSLRRLYIVCSGKHDWRIVSYPKPG